VQGGNGDIRVRNRDMGRIRETGLPHNLEDAPRAGVEVAKERRRQDTPRIDRKKVPNRGTLHSKESRGSKKTRIGQTRKFFITRAGGP